MPHVYFVCCLKQIVSNVYHKSLLIYYDMHHILNPTKNVFFNFLSQLFLKANVNLADLTNTLIAQNYVGSVVTVSFHVHYEIRIVLIILRAQ